MSQRLRAGKRAGQGGGPPSIPGSIAPPNRAAFSGSNAAHVAQSRVPPMPHLGLDVLPTTIARASRDFAAFAGVAVEASHSLAGGPSPA